LSNRARGKKKKKKKTLNRKQGRLQKTGGIFRPGGLGKEKAGPKKRVNRGGVKKERGKRREKNLGEGGYDRLIHTR